MISGIGILLDPTKRNRGGRCCKNNSLSGVNSLKIGLRIVSGSLPTKTFESLNNVKERWLIHCGFPPIQS